MKKVIYQCFDNDKTLLRFPYPPVYRETDADYICFSTDRDITSKCWKMVYVAAYSESELENTLSEYEERMELATDSIQVGPMFDVGFDKYKRTVEITDFSEILGMKFDKEKIIPTCDEEGKYIYKKNPAYTGGKYEGRDKLLTIGVPVSNQIGTIDRCLSHIKPLLDKLDAELVVVDTGSTDGTIEVCREYGARVVEFPWCDNMSAARNMAINAAKGLWYMSIDDDEWFDDVDDIIDFFKSGRYKKVQVATYVQRNYVSKNAATYSDTPVLRIAKITPGLHFEGRIHDALVIDNVKDCLMDCLDSYANHYGFAKDDANKMREKYKRNVSILIQDLYEYPMNGRYNFQLANEFCVVNEDDKAIPFFFRALSMEQEAGVTIQSRHNAVGLIVATHKSKNKDLLYIAELLEDRYDFSIVEKAYFSHMKAEIALINGCAYEDVLRFYNDYVKYQAIYEKNPKVSTNTSHTGLHVCNKEIEISAAHVFPFCAYMGLGDEEKALAELEVIDKEAFFDEKHPVYEYIHMGSGTAFARRMQGLARVQREGRMQRMLYGYVRYICREDTEVCDLQKLADTLAWYDMNCVLQFFAENEKDIEELFWEKIFTQDNTEILDSGIILPVQLKACYSYYLKRSFAKLEKGTASLEAFIKYIRVTAELAYMYFNPALMEDEISTALPTEFRAACLAWQGCNAPSLQIMIQSLKEALELYPEFHYEIGELLKAVSN